MVLKRLRIYPTESKKLFWKCRLRTGDDVEDGGRLEFTELKSSFSKQSTEITGLKTALDKAQQANNKLKRPVDSLKKETENQECEINELLSRQLGHQLSF